MEIEPAEAYFIARMAKEAVESFAPKPDDRRTPHRKRLDMYTGLSAEFALHRLTGTTWFAGLRQFSTPSDVGPYQVKATRYTNYHLLVPPDAPDGMPFLLAIVHGRLVRFVGWCAADEAETRGERRHHPDVPPHLLWVPQRCLRAMFTIERSTLCGPRPGGGIGYEFLDDGFRSAAPSDAIRALAAVLTGASPEKILRFEDWNQGYRSEMSVLHDDFGPGTIIRLAHRHGQATATVAFNSGQVHKIPLDSPALKEASQSPMPANDIDEPLNVEKRRPALPGGLGPGSRIRHAEFGSGTLVQIVFKKGRKRAVVDFDEIGYKTLTTDRHVFTPDSE